MPFPPNEFWYLTVGFNSFKVVYRMDHADWRLRNTLTYLLTLCLSCPIVPWSFPTQQRTCRHGTQTSRRLHSECYRSQQCYHGAAENRFCLDFCLSCLRQLHSPTESQTRRYRKKPTRYRSRSVMPQWFQIITFSRDGHMTVVKLKRSLHRLSKSKGAWPPFKTVQQQSTPCDAVVGLWCTHRTRIL